MSKEQETAYLMLTYSDCKILVSALDKLRSSIPYKDSYRIEVNQMRNKIQLKANRIYKGGYDG